MGHVELKDEIIKKKKKPEDMWVCQRKGGSIDVD